MKRFLSLAVLAGTVCVLQAQPVQERRASMRGGGSPNSGKCTIEVRVDGSAEVEISGEVGRLRTLTGQPATWTRMECNAPLPRDPGDFRFRGIDGRGRQELRRDPRSNRGVAVVYIEDTKGGSEGYTFDIEWGGGSGGFGPAAGRPGGPGGYERGPGGPGPGRGSSRIATERALEVCRSEVRLRAEREYGLRGIEITNAALDDNPGRRDWITGTFSERGAGFRRGGGYRFACSVDFSNGAVRSVDITRADGGPMRGGPVRSGYEPRDAIRFCQDAVVARMNRDGYQNVRFGGNKFSRNDYLVGTATGERGRLVDNFEYNCTIDNGGRVRSVEVQRR